MNGSPVAGLVRRWVDLYTRGLPADERAARRDEIDDDLWCEHAEAAADGRSARTLDADLIMRLLFGMPADVSWRLAYRRARTPSSLERSSPMGTRALGVLAIVAGSATMSLVILDRLMGAALWTSAVALLAVVSVFAFMAGALGLAWRFHDRISLQGAVGAMLVAVGSVLTFAQVPSTAALGVGSAMLMWDLARIRVLSRRAAFANLAAAVLLIGLAAANLMETGNALSVVLIPPFALSWIAIGVSLLRGVPQAQAHSG